MSDVGSGAATGEPVALRASVTRSGTAAMVNFSFANDGREPLAIFDRPTEYAALRVPDAIGRHLSHVELLDEGVVLLGVIVPFPGAKSVEVSVIPCVTVVAPGTQVARSMTLPLPLDEFNSYYGVLPESATKLMTGSAVAIWVDYLWLGPDVKLIRDEKSGCERVEALPFAEVRRAKVGVGGVQLPIRRRFDRFHEGK